MPPLNRALALATALTWLLGCTGAAAQQHARPQHSGPDFRRPREVPEKLDLSRTRTSERRAFRVTIRPRQEKLAINRIHEWTVTVVDGEGGAPVTDARIEFDGGMPAHDHGFPTQPRVTRPVSDGTYLIEGVKFNMSGWWRFAFVIHRGDLSDRVHFNVVIED